MKVGIFYNSIANPAKFPNKTMLMDNFAQGVIANGDVVVKYSNRVLPTEQLDAGFVLGYTLEQNFRRSVIDHLKSENTPVVFVDSNVLNYAKPNHEWHRYSLNSVYPDSGTYFFRDIVPRWQTYSEWHGVVAKPQRQRGNYVLLLAQRPYGWNMFGNDQSSWIDKTIERILSVSAKQIKVRMHPGDESRYRQHDVIKARWKNRVEVSTTGNIRDDLNDCWAAVGYNSTPNVVAAIEGIPVYVDDPVHSWASDVALTDLSELANPILPDRTQWLEKIANIHWSGQEVRSGLLWNYIRQHISVARQ